jgi:hypothetical protein
MIKNSGMVNYVFVFEGIMILFTILTSIFIWKTFHEYYWRQLLCQRRGGVSEFLNREVHGFWKRFIRKLPERYRTLTKSWLRQWIAMIMVIRTSSYLAALWNNVQYASTVDRLIEIFTLELFSTFCNVTTLVSVQLLVMSHHCKCTDGTSIHFFWKLNLVTSSWED